MNFIFRGFKSLIERKGKTFIMFLIMLTVSLVTLTSFSIQSATNLASDAARQKLGATVSLTQDIEKLMEEARNSSEEGIRGQRIEQVPVPTSYIDELISSEYVIDYSVTSNSAANLDDTLLAVGVEETTESTTDQTGGNRQQMATGDITLTGVSNMINEDKVTSGLIELIDGRELTEDDLNSNVILMEQSFAELNSLVVGDTINLNSYIDETIVVTAEIVGIFADSSEVSESAFRMTSQLPYNNMYVPYTLSNELKGTTDSVDSIKLYLNDPLNIDTFMAEVSSNSNIDFDTFKLDANSASYDAMMGPIENVASFSKTTLIIVLVFGGLVLTLVIMLSIKDRVHEMGILMGLGEKKYKIVLQLLTETVTVLIVCLCLSSLVGETISSTVADQLISQEISTSEETNNGFSSGRDQSRNPFTGNTTSVDAIDELDVSINSEDLVKMSLCSLGITMVATIIPSSFVMRLNPKTILSRHN
ncbi:MAG: ABC transporter permease [Peptostreptococcaceae bacterium]